MQPFFTVPALAGAILLAATVPAHAQKCCDPDGPFTLGEDFPETPATCETMGYWQSRAPNDLGRISMAITGVLTNVKFDGALAYLTMCGNSEPQVLCITYSTNGMKVGDKVAFAGGYNRAGKDRVVLDPCLASRD